MLLMATSTINTHQFIDIKGTLKELEIIRVINWSAFIVSGRLTQWKCTVNLSGHMLKMANG